MSALPPGDIPLPPLWKRVLPAIVVALTNVFFIGLGMGVPVFAILWGIPVGWRLARRHGIVELTGETARTIALASAGLAGVTFLVMLVLWGPMIPVAFDPAVDATEFGIPLMLYTSRASAIGWVVLMIVISPALQYMATVASALTTAALSRR